MPSKTLLLVALTGFWLASTAFAEDPSHFLGSPSCGSASCHNLNQGRGKTGSEYTTWTGFDPHHQAYEALFHPRSDRIMKNLFNTGAGSAGSNQLCLNCHATNRGDARHAGPGFTLTEGVGCESCHGGASKYISVHFTAKSLAMSSSEKEEKLGLRNTRDLSSRAAICADCHVGNAGRGMEVNHDLIAAGHPRLNFELSAFLANYPKHWKDADERKRHPDFQARAWEVGQIESARAALKLLADRAEPKAPGPWPEFTEYDCFSCHKDLRMNGRNYRHGYSGKPGSSPWGTWFYNDTLKMAIGKEFESAFPQDLKKEMGAWAEPRKAARLARAADSALALASRHVQSAPTRDAGKIRASMKQLADLGAARGDRLSWDEGAQIFLGLAAMHNTWSDLNPGLVPGEITRDLEKLRSLLRNSFPKGFDSPKLFEDVFPQPTGRNHASDTFSTVFESLQSSLVATRR